jgi:HSP20 family protein
MLLAKNNNVFDTFFGDPWFNDPWFDDRDIQKAEKKLYGHNEKKLMLTDIK